MHAGCERTEGLGEHHIRAAVQQADGLGVAGNRHGGDGAFGGQLLELDAHGGDKLAHAAGEIGVQVLGNAGLNQLCFDLLGGECGGCRRPDGCVLRVVFSHGLQCTPRRLMLRAGGFSRAPAGTRGPRLPNGGDGA